MSKITLTDLADLQNEITAVTAINANNAILETAFDNTLSRNGTSPNTMNAVIDMNSNQIINLPAPSTVNSPARLVDVVSNPTIVVPGTGTSGHTVPFLDGNNTWSGTNTFNANVTTGAAATSTFNGPVVFNGTTNLNTGSTVDRTAMALLNPANVKQVVLTEAGREGLFVWTLGNFTTQATSDPRQGIYVTSSVLPITTGAWVRVNNGYFNVKWFGAKGDGITDDTTSFQAAINIVGSGGRIIMPVGNYQVGALNATNKRDFIVEGEGASSKLTVIGQDGSGNWFDIVGSDGLVFQNFSVLSNGGVVPNILFPWLASNASGSLTSLIFNNVYIKAATTLAFLYGYNYGNVGQSRGGGSLKICDSTWIQTNNGPLFGVGTTTPYLRNSVVQLNADNANGITSANTTVSAGAARCWGTYFSNFYAMDSVPAFVGSPSIDNNACVILYRVDNFCWSSGACEGHCDATLVIWADCQGLQFDSIQFQADDGGVAHVNKWVLIGGGLNAFINFINPFWSDPNLSYIDFGPGTSVSAGGVWFLNIMGNNVAGVGAPPFGFISNISGPGLFLPANPWLKTCNIQTYVATTITTGGSVDAHTIFQGIVTVSVPGGATDTSHHF